jgi:hypothetical protein
MVYLRKAGLLAARTRLSNDSPGPDVVSWWYEVGNRTPFLVVAATTRGSARAQVMRTSHHESLIPVTLARSRQFQGDTACPLTVVQDHGPNNKVHKEPQPG